MLSLSRKVGQTIEIEDVEISVKSIHGSRVVLDVNAAPQIAIMRGELAEEARQGVVARARMIARDAARDVERELQEKQNSVAPAYQVNGKAADESKVVGPTHVLEMQYGDIPPVAVAFATKLHALRWACRFAARIDPEAMLAAKGMVADDDDHQSLLDNWNDLAGDHDNWIRVVQVASLARVAGVIDGYCDENGIAGETLIARTY